MARHVDEYAGPQLAEAEVDQVLDEGPHASTLLDVGSGFGAFIVSARRRGLRAFGVDIGGFETDFAARRLCRLEIGPVLARGDAHLLPFVGECFDVVTLWNVLEHVRDPDRVMIEVARVLRPRGLLILVCPNYLAPRFEAHYHLPWLPLMPRPLARRYLRWLGRDSTFFSEAIHYRTNWGVLRSLHKAGLEPHDSRGAKIARPSSIRSPVLRGVVSKIAGTPIERLLRALLWISFRNPLRPSVSVSATKRG